MDQQSPRSNTNVPESVSTERVVLARALSSKEEALELVSKASEELFWNHAHKLIYLSIRDIIAKSGTPDLVTVSERLKESGAVKLSDLSELVTAAFDSRAEIGQLVHILEQAATEREVMKLVIEAQRDLAAQKSDVLPKLTSNLLQLNRGFTAKTLFSAQELASEYFDTLVSREKQGGVAGIPFGYKALDLATAGAKPGQLIIIAARPSQGKSAFAENIIANMLKRNVKVYFVSAETGRGEVMDRMIGRMTGLGHNELMRGVREDDSKVGLVQKALAQVYELPLYLQDNPAITSDQIFAEASRLKLQDKVDVVVVDYLQFLRDKTERGETRERTIARISQNLKSLARSINVPVIVTAQLGRDASKNNARPELHHLRESGQLEQDADVAVLLWRGDQDTEPDITHFDIAKNRSGRTGEFVLRFNGALTKFEDHFPQYAPTTPQYPQIGVAS